jgi:hypothetical protein
LLITRYLAPLAILLILLNQFGLTKMAWFFNKFETLLPI